MEIKGISGSSGLAIGKVFLYIKEEPVIPETQIPPETSDEEIKRFDRALIDVEKEITRIRDHTLNEIGEDEAAIFSAHIALLRDRYLIKEVHRLIKEKNFNAAKATREAIAKFAGMFSKVEDEYIRERASDLKDIGNRLIRTIFGIRSSSLADIREKVVIVARDLTPSDTVSINRKYIVGFVTDEGNITSHTAILARSMDIPAVLGLGEITRRVINGENIIVDGTVGKVVIAPTQDEIEIYQKKIRSYENYKSSLNEWAKAPAITRDGVSIELWGNIGGSEEVQGVLDKGASGIGLFRTEFLYMGKKGLPHEDEQFHVYKSVAQQMNGRPVIIRTLDIGGDKELPYLQMPKEANPFLGWRAIRISLDMREMFKIQLRAILRAGVFGNVLVMYPMITGIEEFREANMVLEEAKAELVMEGIPFQPGIQTGVMIETPSAALIADFLAKEADFLSIGTNDLCQYSMAADRMNPRVAHLYQPFHPAMLRMIQNVIDLAHENNKKVGVCGEMAANPLGAIALLGMGLDELSMSGSALPRVKMAVRGVSFTDACKAAGYILTLSTAKKVGEYLKNRFPHIIKQGLEEA